MPDREGFGESRSPPEAETIISSAAASQPRTNGWVSAEGIEASRANCTRGALAWTCAAGVGYPPNSVVRRSVASADSCYWARLSGFGGTLDDIIANYFGNSPTTVDRLTPEVR